MHRACELWRNTTAREREMRLPLHPARRMNSTLGAREGVRLGMYTWPTLRALLNGDKAWLENAHSAHKYYVLDILA